MTISKNITKEDILLAISEMTVMETCELVRMINEKFDLPAFSPVAASSEASVKEDVVEEQQEFDVVLIAAGANKIGVIKTLRTVTNLGLKEAKDAVDSTVDKPYLIKDAMSKEDALALQKQFVEAGATVELK